MTNRYTSRTWRRFIGRVALQLKIPSPLEGEGKGGGGVVALVAGGYHTEGITRILKANRVAYAVVTPKIESLGDEQAYAQVLRRLAEKQALAHALMRVLVTSLHAFLAVNDEWSEEEVRRRVDARRPPHREQFGAGHAFQAARYSLFLLLGLFSLFMVIMPLVMDFIPDRLQGLFADLYGLEQLILVPAAYVIYILFVHEPAHARIPAEPPRHADSPHPLPVPEAIPYAHNPWKAAGSTWGERLRRLFWEGPVFVPTVREEAIVDPEQLEGAAGRLVIYRDHKNHAAHFGVLKGSQGGDDWSIEVSWIDPDFPDRPDKPFYSARAEDSLFQDGSPQWSFVALPETRSFMGSVVGTEQLTKHPVERLEDLREGDVIEKTVSENSGGELADSNPMGVLVEKPDQSGLFVRCNGQEDQPLSEWVLDPRETFVWRKQSAVKLNQDSAFAALWKDLDEWSYLAGLCGLFFLAYPIHGPDAAVLAIRLSGVALVEVFTLIPLILKAIAYAGSDGELLRTGNAWQGEHRFAKRLDDVAPEEDQESSVHGEGRRLEEVKEYCERKAREQAERSTGLALLLPLEVVASLIADRTALGPARLSVDAVDALLVWDKGPAWEGGPERKDHLILIDRHHQALWELMRPGEYSEVVFERSSSPENVLKQLNVSVWLLQLAKKWEQMTEADGGRWAPLLRSWAPIVHRLSQDFKPWISDSPIAVHLNRKEDGDFTMDPDTGYPKFTLHVNLEFFAALIELMDQLPAPQKAHAQRFLEGCVVKELGGIEYIKNHPYLGRTGRMLDEWLKEELSPYRQEDSPAYSVPVEVLKETRLVELVQHYIARYSRLEAEGYVVLSQYLGDHGLAGADLEALAVITRGKVPQIVTKNLEGFGKVLKEFPPDTPDLAWFLSVNHLFWMFDDPSNKELATEELIGRLAFAVESMAGRFSMTDEGQVSVTSDFMRYLRDVSCNAATPEELMARFHVKKEGGNQPSSPNAMIAGRWYAQAYERAMASGSWLVRFFVGGTFATAVPSLVETICDIGWPILKGGVRVWGRWLLGRLAFIRFERQAFSQFATAGATLSGSSFVFSFPSYRVRFHVPGMDWDGLWNGLKGVMDQTRKAFHGVHDPTLYVGQRILQREELTTPEQKDEWKGYQRELGQLAREFTGWFWVLLLSIPLMGLTLALTPWLSQIFHAPPFVALKFILICALLPFWLPTLLSVANHFANNALGFLFKGPLAMARSKQDLDHPDPANLRPQEILALLAELDPDLPETSLQAMLLTIASSLERYHRDPVIAFDIGGVILEGHNRAITGDFITRMLGVKTPSERQLNAIHEAIFKDESKPYAALTSGQKGAAFADFSLHVMQEIQKILGSRFPKDLSADEFRGLFRAFYFESYREIEENSAVLRKLKEKGVSWGVISNNFWEKYSSLKKKFRIFELADFEVLSDKAKERKPGLKIYRMLLRNINRSRKKRGLPSVNRRHVIFFDDKEENLRPAADKFQFFPVLFDANQGQTLAQNEVVKEILTKGLLEEFLGRLREMARPRSAFPTEIAPVVAEILSRLQPLASSAQDRRLTTIDANAHPPGVEEPHLAAFYSAPLGEVIPIDNWHARAEIIVPKNFPHILTCFGIPHRSGDRYFFLLQRGRILALAKENSEDSTLQVVPWMRFEQWCGPPATLTDRSLRQLYFSGLQSFLDVYRHSGLAPPQCRLANVEPPVPDSHREAFLMAQIVVEEASREMQNTGDDRSTRQLRRAIRRKAAAYWAKRWTSSLKAILLDDDETDYFEITPTVFITSHDNPDASLSPDFSAFNYLVSRFYYQSRMKDQEAYCRSMAEDPGLFITQIIPHGDEEDPLLHVLSDRPDWPFLSAEERARLKPLLTGNGDKVALHLARFRKGQESVPLTGEPDDMESIQIHLLTKEGVGRSLTVVPTLRDPDPLAFEVERPNFGTRPKQPFDSLVSRRVEALRGRLEPLERDALNSLGIPEAIRLVDQYRLELDELFTAKKEVCRIEFEMVYRRAGIDSKIPQPQTMIEALDPVLASYDQARRDIKEMLDRDQLFRAEGPAGWTAIQQAVLRLGLDPSLGDRYYEALRQWKTAYVRCQQAFQRDPTLWVLMTSPERQQALINLMDQVSAAAEKRPALKDYRKPLLVVIAGGSGVGKSLISSAFARIAGLAIGSSDWTRATLRASLQSLGKILAGLLPELDRSSFDFPYNSYDPTPFLMNFFLHAQAILGGLDGEGGIFAEWDRQLVQEEQSSVWGGVAFAPGCIPAKFYEKANVVHLVLDVPGETEAERKTEHMRRFDHRGDDTQSPAREKSRYQIQIDPIREIQHILRDLAGIHKLTLITNAEPQQCIRDALKRLMDPYVDSPPEAPGSYQTRAMRIIALRHQLKTDVRFGAALHFDHDVKGYPFARIAVSEFTVALMYSGMPPSTPLLDPAAIADLIEPLRQLRYPVVLELPPQPSSFWKAAKSLEEALQKGLPEGTVTSIQPEAKDAPEPKPNAMIAGRWYV